VPTLTPNVAGLRCRECGTAEETAPVHVCAMCFGPLRVDYVDDVTVDRAAIASGPRSIWRYASLLPVLEGGDLPDDLAPGWTPLVAAP
jgi:threonine synthase